MYLTADTHFGHRNIIRYSSRPFADLEQMDGGLVDRWNDVVRPTDEVWHLGDVAMGDLDRSLAHVQRLHGRKYLVPGNHDACWPYSREHDSGQVARYTDAGLSVLGVEQALVLAGEEVLVHHFPYRGSGEPRERYAQRRPVDAGRWLLHGHVHEAWRQRGRMLNVGVDVWDYAPVHIDRLSELIRNGAADQDRHGHPTAPPGDGGAT